MGKTVTKTVKQQHSFRQPVDEQWLDKHLVRWRFEQGVSLSQFDVEESLANQNRWIPITDDRVQVYREAMERGDIFPAPIAYRAESGKLVMIDGNHRLLALLKVGFSRINVYVVDANKDIVNRLLQTANDRSGLNRTEAEKIQSAIQLVDGGSTMENAAVAVGVPPSLLKKKHAEEKANRRARNLGVSKKFTALSPSLRRSLVTLNSDPAFVALSKFLVQADQLSITEAKQLISSVRQARSDEGATKTVEHFRQNYIEQLHRSRQQAKGRRVGRAQIPHHAFNMHGSALVKLDPVTVARGFQTSDQQAQALEMAEELLSLSTQVIAEIKKAKPRV